MEDRALLDSSESLKPSTSLTSISMTLIPLNPYFDTLSLLCVMMLLPEWLSFIVLAISIMLGFSRLILGRCLSLLFANLVTNDFYTLPNTNRGNLILSLISPVMMSVMIDTVILFSALVLQHQAVSIIRISLYAVIASRLATFKTKARINSILTITTVILLQLLYNYALNSFDLLSYANYGFTQPSLTINHIYYLKKSWRFTLKFILEFINTLLSIHICILSSQITKFFPFKYYTIPLIEISSSINHLESHNQQASLRSENDFPSIHVPRDVASSHCPSLLNLLEDDFPNEQISNLQGISCSSLVVTQNFENYCVLPSSTKKSIKRKASVRFSQPLWSLLVAIKAMIVAPDAYSGDDYSNELIHYSSSLAKNVTCYVFLTSETAIGLELVGCQPSKLDIIVRINGVIWYQQDAVRFKESTIYVKISMLTRLSEYHIEVLYDLGNGQLESLANLIVSTSSNNPTLQQPIRSSPLITLQQSLETTLENINREKQNLKKLKKEHQKRITNYKTDIASRRKKLDTDKDERNHRKIMSLRTAVSAFEQEYSKVNDEIMEYYSHETEILERFLDNKRHYDLKFRDLAKIENEYELKKKTYVESLEFVNNELSNLQNKHDKLSKKLNKIIEESNSVQLELKNIFTKDTTKRQSLIDGQRKERLDLMNQLNLELSKLNKELELLMTDNDMLKKQISY